MLPFGTTISRPNNDTLLIDSPRISLKLIVTYAGYSANLPKHFEVLFFGVSTFTFAPLEVRIEAEVVIKPWSLLRQRGWQYYEWVDSFLERLDERTSLEQFESRIQWESNVTRLRMSAYLKKHKMEASGGGKPHDVESPERTMTTKLSAEVREPSAELGAESGALLRERDELKRKYEELTKKYEELTKAPARRSKRRVQKPDSILGPPIAPPTPE
jgi:hypothetical protein